MPTIDWYILQNILINYQQTDDKTTKKRGANDHTLTVALARCETAFSVFITFFYFTQSCISQSASQEASVKTEYDIVDSNRNGSFQLFGHL